jgi:16S rRNA (guanine966-N2)-methyltransferase
MRIIAGLAKGRNLFSPIGATRPTSDRAREALFSTLESEFGSINDLTFLDLYCGSGAVGAEALSRGAAVVYAVDNDEKAINITSVITSSVGKFLDKTCELAFDVVFLDPPYDLPNIEIEKALTSLVKNKYLKNSSVIAIERDSKSKRLNWPQGLKELKERKYGAATIFYAEPANED